MIYNDILGHSLDPPKVSWKYKYIIYDIQYMYDI